MTSHISPLAPTTKSRGAIGHFFVGRSLSDYLESGRDNILLLRMIAALLVLAGHSIVLVGPKAGWRDPVHEFMPATYTHLLGVMMFFVISGYLITLSWLRRPELPRFLLARVLRLWPALIANVVLLALVVGPIVTRLPRGTYFSEGDAFGTAYQYVYRNASLLEMHWFLPGVFTTNPVQRYVNGSLWTIPIEALMYGCVALLGLAGILRRRWLAVAVIVLACSVWVLWPAFTGKVPTGGTAWLGRILMGLFGAGSLFCLLRRYLPVSTGMMIVVVAVCVLQRHSLHARPFLWLAVAYVTIWLAYVPRLPTIPKRMDLSYGTYLWAFPMQQIVLLSGLRNPWLLSAVTTPIVLVIAAASWWLMEKPVLSLKGGIRGSRRSPAPQSAVADASMPYTARSAAVP